MDYNRLGRTVAFALRHNPWIFELELDEEGWVDVDVLVQVLREERKAFRTLTVDDLYTMIDVADKQRYEIKDGRIRALYGHSSTNSIKKIPAEPPPILLHGTNASVLDVIMKHGLKPMSRQFVHMSLDRETAVKVAKRRSEAIVVLEIAAKRAYDDGVTFYQGNEHVWLADGVPAAYITVVDE
jgi:putative RNA 2'-phosphotransferase